MLLHLVSLLVVVVSAFPADVASVKDLDCSPIEGLVPLLEPGSVLLLGEIHGTAQSPAFVGSTACNAFSKGLGVTVGLELPQRDQPSLDVFLASDGGAAARAVFLKSPFWTSDYQDGRATEALFSLMQDLRRWRQAGHPVSVVLMDRPEVFRERDEAMAARLLAAIKTSPRNFFVTLTGNLHNRTANGSGRMGTLVAAEMPEGRLRSLNLSHQGGTAWICTGSSAADCGSRKLKGRGTASKVRITLWDSVNDRGFHGIYDVGPITASPPEALRVP